jgi:DNA-binding transcriptional LysR family regulator
MYLDLIASACNQADFTPQIAPEAPRILSTLNLVAAGLGVTLTPESLQSLHMDVIAYRSVPSDPLLTAPLNLECRNTDQPLRDSSSPWRDKGRVPFNKTKAAKLNEARL